MKQLKLVCFLLLFSLLSVHLMASSEIDIDTDIVSVSATATPAPAGSVLKEELTPTPTVLIPTPTVEAKAAATVVSKENSDEAVETPVPTVLVVHGVLKMLDVYKAGLSYYKKQDFAKAIRYLKQSLQVQDPYTPKYYYAEANAMLGVIYQFHIINEEAAYSYYKEALAIDPETATARKHIRELSGRKVSK